MTQVARPTSKPHAKDAGRAPLESDSLAARLVAMIIEYRPAPSREAMAREARRILAGLGVEVPA